MSDGIQTDLDGKQDVADIKTRFDGELRDVDEVFVRQNGQLVQVWPEGTNSSSTSTSDPPVEMIDAFDRDSLNGGSNLYDLGDTGAFSLTTATTHDGSAALTCDASSNSVMVSTSGLDHYPSPGDVWEVWTRINDSGTSQIWWAAQDLNNAYQLSVDSGTAALFSIESGSFQELTSVSISPPTGDYIRALIAYGADVMSVLLDDGEGTDHYATLSTQHSAYQSGGVGFRLFANDSDTGDQAWWDEARMRNYINDMEYSPFSPSRESSNPVTFGTSGNPNQAYVPAVAKGPDGTFYQVTKSAPYLWGFSSSDGVTWTDEGQILSLGSDSSWESNKHSWPVLNYNPDDSTWYLYYTGNESGGAPRRVGLATSSSPLSGYTKHADNPIADASAVGSQYDMLQFMDHVIYNGTHYWYGYARDKNDEGTNPNKLVLYSGSTWTDPTFDTVLLDGANVPVPGNSLIGANVFIDDSGTWRWTFTAGRLGEDVWNEMRLYSADGSGPKDFTPRKEVMLTPGDPGKWSERRVYDSIWLKKQDGNYLTPRKPDGNLWMYYSGHNVAGGGTNEAWNGLARYESLPSPTNLEAMV